MDQVKVGKFIIELRKEKELTQKQLADKLEVSNRAVSKWENGICLPDAERLLSLSKIFDVSVNELLSGERIPKEDYIEHAENNLLDASKYHSRKDLSEKILYYGDMVVNLLLLVFCLTRGERSILIFFSPVILFLVLFLIYCGIYIVGELLGKRLRLAQDALKASIGVKLFLLIVFIIMSSVVGSMEVMKMFG